MKGKIYRYRIVLTLAASIACGILALVQINLSNNNRIHSTEELRAQGSLIGEETSEEIQELLQLVRKESIDIVRANMIDEIGKKGAKAKSAVVDLIGIVESDSSDRVKAAAIRTLEKIGDPAAVSSIVKALEDEDTDVRLKLIAEPAADHDIVALVVPEFHARLHGVRFIGALYRTANGEHFLSECQGGPRFIVLRQLLSQ